MEKEKSPLRAGKKCFLLLLALLLLVFTPTSAAATSLHGYACLLNIFDHLPDTISVSPCGFGDTACDPGRNLMPTFLTEGIVPIRIVMSEPVLLIVSMSAIPEETKGCLNRRDLDCDGIINDQDEDKDADGVPNQQDNCPSVYNPDQENSDWFRQDRPVGRFSILGDDLGDACDNCPLMANPDQNDHDIICEGRVHSRDDIPPPPMGCYVKPDGKGDLCDNCPEWYNPDQADADGDSIGDACDSCPTLYQSVSRDTDKDTVDDACDNCPTMLNVDQKDRNGDGIGDACDCADGIKGPHERGIDCGGTCATPCAGPLEESTPTASAGSRIPIIAPD